MPTRADLPTVEPQWDARPITAAEIVAIAHGREVRGVNPDDTRIREMRRGLLGNGARTAFDEARRTGYLLVNRHLLYQDGAEEKLRLVWTWWCVAAGHPDITLTATSTDAEVRCDIATTERAWQTDMFGHIVRMLSPIVLPDHGTWTVTRTLMEVTGMQMGDAIFLARDLVDIATAGRFRPQMDTGRPHIESLRAPQADPMERSDWNG